MQTLRLSAIAAIVAIATLPGCCHLWQKRDPAQRQAFQTNHPCPANGNQRGACPGYQVDHIIALCLGGADTPTNMQWMTIAKHQEKTADDVRRCRSH